MPVIHSLIADVSPYFATDYSGARAKFMAASMAAGVAVDSYAHSLQGPQQQPLSTDVALFGNEHAEKLLIVVSGTHGPEGFAGSGCQVGWVAAGGPQTLPDDVAVLLIHLINPWGTAWGRRQTEDNADLNRNFMNFAQPLPGNDYYDELRDALHCPVRQGTACDEARQTIADFVKRRGLPGLAQALFRGQYHDAQGVGFGGNEPTWSNETFHSILRRYASKARWVGLIDLHTGYGPYGHGLVLSSDEPGGAELTLAQRWYGDALMALKAGGALPYDVTGDLGSGAQKALPHAIVVPVAIEYGTYPVDQLLYLQIDDCWLHHYGDVASEEGRIIRQRLKHFFYPASPDWLQLVSFRANQVIGQALTGLAATRGS